MVQVTRTWFFFLHLSAFGSQLSYLSFGSALFSDRQPPPAHKITAGMPTSQPLKFIPSGKKRHVSSGSIYKSPSGQGPQTSLNCTGVGQVPAQEHRGSLSWAWVMTPLDVGIKMPLRHRRLRVGRE